MSGGWFLRNVGKRYLHPLLERRSLPNSFVSTEAPILAKQQSRTYSPIPLLLFRKVKESGNTTSFYPSSRFFSSSSSSSSNSFIGWYLGMIESRPVLTKSITAGLIYSVADLSAQRMTQTSSESFDLIRTLRMTGYGMLFMGPSLHFWFNFLSRVFPKLDVVTTLKKLIMGQVIYGPIVTATFFSLNAALQGENGVEIIARLKRDLLPTLKNGLIYWPMCDFVTFRFVPVHLQPLMNNSFAFLWTIYLTYMASLKKVEADQIANM